MRLGSGPAAGTVRREYSNSGHACKQSFAIASHAPQISFFFPGRGRAGTTVVLQGKYFTGASAVALHGVAATYTVNSDTRITTKVPKGAPSGNGKWTVTNAAGIGTSTGNFFVG